MGRGLGPTQRAILNTLDNRTTTNPGGPYSLTVADLTRALDRSAPQIRNAIAALRRRELVTVQTAMVGWKGRGIYGDNTMEHGEFIAHQGMPVSGLHVYLPDRVPAEKVNNQATYMRAMAQYAATRQ